MNYEVPEIDYMRTKNNVLNIVKRYDLAIMRLDIGDRPKIIGNYNLDIPPTYGNDFHSSTESAAMYGLEGIKKDKEFVELVTNRLNQLEESHRAIIWLCYFEDKPHEYVADKLAISTSLLSIKKRSAIELFAYGMGVEVLKSD